MTDLVTITIGVLIPLVGTTLGAAMVFFLKKEMNTLLQKLLLGFAAGVMIAASVWSLLIPAINMAEEAGGIAWIPALVGFLLGMGFLLILDMLIPHLHLNSDSPEGRPCGLGKSFMLVFAITLHNIPEGIAIALPIFHASGQKRQAVFYSFLSGIAEPIGGILGFILLKTVMPASMVGALFAAVAGIMVYISFDTLLPLAREYGENHHVIIGIFTGMFMIGLSLILL